ncbi:MAG: lysylphosphatidylglycerol synthase transmembrane domain-containing protein [Haloarculaceae archaeon]
MATVESALDRRTAGKVGVGFLVAVVLLYLFGRVIGWDEITRTLANADPTWFAAALASMTLGLVVWAKAWDEILHLVDVDLPFPSLVVTYFAATFADYVTPFGKVGGGPLIAYVLSTDDRISYHESLASVTTADMLNLLPYFGFAVVGLVGLLIHGGVPRRARLLVGALAGVAVLVAAGAALAWRFRGRVEALLVGTLAPLLDRVPLVDAASVREEVRGFYEEVDRISDSPRNLAYTLIFSVIGWVFFAAPLYLAARTLGVPIHPLVVLFVVPASTVAGVVPTPGGLGGVEFALVGLLVVLTPMTAGVAAGVALVYRVASYWWVVGIGGLATLYEVYRT